MNEHLTGVLGDEPIFRALVAERGNPVHATDAEMRRAQRTFGTAFAASAGTADSTPTPAAVQPDSNRPENSPEDEAMST